MDRFQRITIGMGPEEVAAAAGEPNRREIFLEGECWSYEEHGVDIVFSGEKNLKVCKIIFRAGHTRLNQNE